MRFSFETLKDFKELIQHLASGITKLSFSDNFEGFKTNATISAGAELSIKNQLKFIPSSYIILSQTGNGLVTKGSTQWDLNNLYLFNNGAVSVTITVLFLR